MSDTTKPGFTPGPWELDIEDESVDSASGAMVCSINYHKSVNTIHRTGQTFSHADGYLIAAAPDLHAALLVQMDATRYAYNWCRSGMAEPSQMDVINEIEAKYPFLIAEPRTPDARMHMLREHADRLSVAALAKAEGKVTG